MGSKVKAVTEDGQLLVCDGCGGDRGYGPPPQRVGQWCGYEGCRGYMKLAAPAVPDQFPACRGVKCDKGMPCIEAEACLYKSSADEAREMMAMMERAGPGTVTVLDADDAIGAGMRSTFGTRADGQTVDDYSGAVDGGGYKRSFDDPKKVPLSLIPPTLPLGIAAVLGKGAKKYAPGNWMRGMSWCGVLDALQRHILAFQSGEDLDPETGLSHLFHAGCCLAFLAHFAAGPRAEEYKQFDDRLFGLAGLADATGTP